ncbi:MAG: 50S ribosomal protein L9 [Verrucomicrobiales bacterium]|nr:50S ribosomal protein L9 [Verrucomicrobiales bacterium]|tara:strand:+ start:4042 stop:4548 length:507 start_codon:yes stop_codon:yes gene_type:complete
MSQIDVILKEKVENLGAEADVIKVRRGYALNFLIPTGKAFEATKGNLKQIESLKKARAIRESDELESATKLANRLNKQRLKFELATGQGGKAFGSVTTKDIQNSLAETDRQFRDIDRKQIDLKKPIKRTGDFDVDIKIHPDVTATLKLKVSAVVTDQKGQDGQDRSDS